MSDKKTIPIEPMIEPSNCAGAEPFALMVLDDMMQPEFLHGEIIVCEPEGVARDGSFVVAKLGAEYYFRQLQIDDGRWRISALNPAYPSIDLQGPEDVIAVVILKKKPGRRKEQKSYI
jgi:SOS-response transcriptional repressor LexA